MSQDNNNSIIGTDIISHDQFSRIDIVSGVIGKGVSILDVIKAVENSRLTDMDVIPINANEFDVLKQIVKRDAEYHNVVNISTLLDKTNELLDILKKRKRIGITVGNRFSLSRSSEYTKISFENEDHINKPSGVSFRIPGERVGKVTIKNLGSGVLEVGIGIMSGTVETETIFSIEPNDSHEVVSDEKEISYVQLKSQVVDVTVNVIAEL